RAIVWPEKSMLAIEEYIFARYYMYQNVYLHKTTRGFEKMLEAMWRRAKQFYDDGKDGKGWLAFEGSVSHLSGCRVGESRRHNEQSAVVHGWDSRVRNSAMAIPLSPATE